MYVKHHQAFAGACKSAVAFYGSDAEYAEGRQTAIISTLRCGLIVMRGSSTSCKGMGQSRAESRKCTLTMYARLLLDNSGRQKYVPHITAHMHMYVCGTARPTNVAVMTRVAVGVSACKHACY